MKKNIFIMLIFLLITVSPFVYSVSCSWSKYGANPSGDFIQYNCNSIIVNDYLNTNLSFDSSYSPLIYDLNNDNYNELIVVKDNEIKLYNNNLNLIDAYYNPALNPSGQFVISDFDDSNSYYEIVMIVNNNSDFRFLVIEWNGYNFSITKNIDIPDKKSDGLNCINIDGDSDIECLYFSNESQLYAYDFTNNFNTTALYYYGSDDDYANYSIPKFMDIETDLDNDIAVIWDNNGYRVLVLENDGLGNFNLQHEYTTNNMGVNNIVKANLDGGQHELIILSSYFYYSASPPTKYSTMYVYNIVDNSLKCSKIYNYESLNSPYLVNLKLEDYDGDGFNDIWVYDFGDSNATLKIFDENCNELYSKDLEDTQSYLVGTASDKSTPFSKGIFADFGGSEGFEFSYMGGIWTTEGNLAIQLGDYNNDCKNTYWKSDKNNIIIGDITNNGLNDYIIESNCNGGEKISLFSFNYTNINAEIVQPLYYNTGNPVCVNNNVEFSLRYDDVENDYVRLVSDCYGDNNTVNGTFYKNGVFDGDSYIGIAYINCYYNETENYNAKFYLHDLIHNTDLTQFVSYTVTVTNSEFCNSEGEGSGSSESEIGVSGGVNDWSSQIPDWLNDWGFKSSASKIFFGICIIVALILIANREHKSAFISVLVGIMGMIGLMYLGILPVWLIFLIFLFTAMLVFLFIFKIGGSED